MIFLHLKSLKKNYTDRIVHDHEELLILSGLYTEFNKAQQDIVFKGHWSIVRNWDENARYLTGMAEKDAKDFLTSVWEMLKWIEKQL